MDMHETGGRLELASDNTAAVCPEALAALQKANSGAVPSYGDDPWTARLRERIREIFETDCVAHLVFNGTAANALALAQLCQPFHSVVCHDHAHIQTDECGAPEFFTGGSKLLLVAGANGKIDLDQAEAVIARQPEVHAHKPRVISVTQSTELGTVYRPEELAAAAELARKHNMYLHMDGARFSNAVASLGCAPKEITWKLGVDVLCFGGTKNGVAAGELVIFFKQELAREFDYRIKQAGQLASKMRFLAAPWVGLLTGGTWLSNARYANQMANRLGEQLRTKTELNIVFPVEASAVFVPLNAAMVRELHDLGWHFYRFVEPDIYRIMCSWSTTDAEVDAFVTDVCCIQEKLADMKAK
jgi:threonine aldolase